MWHMKSSARNLVYGCIRRLVDMRDGRGRTNASFPINRGHNYLYESLFPAENGVGHYTKFYAEDVENPLTIDYKRFKTEIVQGRRYAGGDWHEIDCVVPSAVPYAITGDDMFNHRSGGEIEFQCPEGRFTFGNLVAERFYYLPIKVPGKIAFRSKHDLIIGEPLPLVQAVPHKRKLVLVLFLDNLGWGLTEQVPLEESMPQLARYFSKGCVFDNYFVNSNWTLPSVATLFSAQPLARHKMFHPTADHVVGTGYQTLAEMFQRDDYLTFQACGNGRKSPRYGYAKGFDRTVYRNQLSMSDVLDSYMSHMQAFPDRDCFAWLSIFDLHHPMGLLPDVAVQINTPLEGHDYRTDHEKSPLQLNRDDGRTIRYLAEMKRVDARLAPLLRWIEDTYDDDEIVVAAVSDHGTTFVTDDTKPLTSERCHGAFMLRGGGIPAGRSDEFVQSMDLMPTLVELCGIPFDGHTKGRLPEALGGPLARRYAYSEIMYPAAPYTAVVRDGEFTFVLETVAPVSDAGKIDLHQTRTQLFRQGDEDADVSAEYPDVCAAFAQTVRAHVADNE